MHNLAQNRALDHKFLVPGLVLAILLQALVMTGVLLTSLWPLWTGTEIRLKTRPVDPRSLFRGNYARLSYDISQIPTADLASRAAPRANEPVYITLSPGPDGLHQYKAASFERPQQGTYIRGRIQPPIDGDDTHFRVRYGIEAYFAPKEKALALERRLRDAAVAVVRVAGSGRPALKDIRDRRQVDVE